MPSPRRRLAIIITIRISQIAERKVREGKIEGRRRPGRKETSWLKNLRNWYGVCSIALFRSAAFKIRIAIMIADLRLGASTWRRGRRDRRAKKGQRVYTNQSLRLSGTRYIKHAAIEPLPERLQLPLQLLRQRPPSITKKYGKDVVLHWRLNSRQH